MAAELAFLSFRASLGFLAGLLAFLWGLAQQQPHADSGVRALRSTLPLCAILRAARAPASSLMVSERRRSPGSCSAGLAGEGAW